MYKIILEAHRGVGTEFPENTLSAFHAAVEQGYRMIELDTKFTKDNKCVLLHDRTINRTGRYSTGKTFAENRFIADMTLEEAQKLDFGMWKSPVFAGEKIPVLEQVLDMALECRIPLKFDNVLWSHTAEQQNIFFETIRAKNAQHIAEITCADMNSVKSVRKYLPDSKIHYDGPVTQEKMEEIADAVPKELLTAWLRFDNKITSWCKNPPVTEESAALVKKFGRLGVWLLTEAEELETAVKKYNADIAETDGRLKPIKEKG